jgi:hypothetical protein
VVEQIESQPQAACTARGRRFREGKESGEQGHVHLEAAGALHVHEVRVGLLDKLVELVKLGLVSLGGVKKVVVDLGSTGGRMRDREK